MNFDALRLGQLMSQPVLIPGSRQHEVWKVQTDQGCFAVKKLNTQRFNNPGTQDVFEQAESFANFLVSAGISTVSAIKFDGQFVMTAEQNYLVFPWVEGITFSAHAVHPDQAYLIGQSLANIHAVTKVREDGSVFSHTDINQANVIWTSAQTPVIIDWECAGFIDPGVELIGAALNWGGITQGPVNEFAFKAVLRGYESIAGYMPDITQQTFANGLSSWLDWLSFNLDKSVLSACVNEQQSSEQEFFRRIRNAVGNVQQIFILKRLLLPNYGAVSFMFWSGKVLRVLTSVLLFLVLITALIGSFYSSVLLVFLLAQCLFYAIATLRHFNNKLSSKITALIYYFSLGHTACLIGTFLYFTPQKHQIWKKYNAIKNAA